MNHRLRLTLIVLSVSAFGACAAHRALADTAVAPAGVSIQSTGLVGGDLKIYTGPVTIIESPTERVHVEAQPGQLLFRRIGATQGDAIGATPFDPTTESFEMVNGALVLSDALGHTITIHPAMAAPSAGPVQPGAPASDPAASVSSDDPGPTPPKKPRRIDPVTDRGHVIP